MPAIEVSWGELIDRITILEIKQQELTSPAAVANVRKEPAALAQALAGLGPAPAALDGLKRELKAINEALRHIENPTRAKEAAKTFDHESSSSRARSISTTTSGRASSAGSTSS
jgi:hypothetical protein